MKYIRTENAIEEVLKEEGKLLFTRHGYIPKDMAIQASDSIEELLEAFVVVFNDEGRDIHKYFPISSYDVACLVDEVGKYNPKIYGGIWTDKGLKYVAKISNEGELELL